MTESIDLFLFYLRRHLEVLDLEIENILTRIRTSNDPEGDGYYDTGEYFVGAGFVAVQKYMTETFCFLGVEQTEALSAGPKLAGGVSFANGIWSAANYWKHDAEWWKGAVDFTPQDSDGMSPIKISWPAGGKFKSSVSILEDFGALGQSYVCSNVLAALADDAEELRLKSILPYLKTWRISLE